MLDSPKVSVVVPIYNVEPYLRQCLDSILNQTLREIEVICINDGSPDRCGEIIDEYAARDSRLRAIHQENGGYGVAVNHGFKLARGCYIGIIESDDWVEPTMFERLHKQAEEMQADVAKCDFTYYKGDGVFQPSDSVHKIAPEGTVFTLLENPSLFLPHVSIWSAIYKRDFLVRHQIMIEESRSASYQDMPFAALVYAKGAKVTLVHDHLINYRVEEGMNSSTIRTDGRLMMMPVQCELAKQYFIEYGYWEAVKEVAAQHFYNCSVGMFFQCESKYQREFFRKLVSLFEGADFDISAFTQKKRHILSIILADKYWRMLLFIRLKRVSRYLQMVCSFKSSRDKKYRVLTIFGLCFNIKR